MADISNATLATNDYVDSVKSAAKNVNSLSDSYNKAAESLIGLSVAVVSKPISTTAFVAIEMGKPSIILDPTMNTQFNDPGLRDCKLAYTADQLFQFIEESLDS